ncbi:helix-turn-helix domain-containing protein [Paenibacillus sp. NPDC057886]|uniref:helix-turn-helix domain-containing protein n=1 Tax=Paenibacillus sp. NPDC057886 TaxID=3346270 RepID=UPI0036BB2216
METSEIVQRGIDYIEEHPYEPLSLENIAEAAVMSVPNLYRLFYAMTGHPIKEYVRKRRISEAASLLRYTDHATIDIGIGCGFQSYQTFFNTFKRSTGLTPGQYRQAEFIFSVEQINLHERVTYLEEREVFDRFPNVKVIRRIGRRRRSITLFMVIGQRQTPCNVERLMNILGIHDPVRMKRWKASSD